MSQAEIPEWVHVWRWARTHRKPPETRQLPQQDSYGDRQSITQTEYETLANEWRTAQKPQSTIADILDELAS